MRRPNLNRALAVALCCAPLGMGCDSDAAHLPSIGIIQSAYDEAKLEEVDRHDDQLHIEDADCRSLGQDKFSCQVGFTDKRSTNGRLYFDVIGIDKLARGWRLISGLCRR